ncbi:MAG: hypothetical protein V2J07_06750 [Anaerolineae bacterium]|jgi:hypothetical protein|nr:hypothetical protein [Anaerolineae bacterium]
MRLFEILFFFFTAMTLVFLFPIKGSSKKILLIFIGLSILTLTGHLLIEKTRWQMVPAFVFSALLIGYLMVSYLMKKDLDSIAPRRWVWIIAVILLIFCILPPILFPVPSLPKPTGTYSVGVTSFEWVDDGRAETLAPTPVGDRKIMVQVWYPAEIGANAELAPYMEQMDVTGPVLASQFGLPDFLFNHIILAKTHSYLNVPISTSESQYPILIFSHGWTGVRTQNTYQAEELASHGYIVIAPDHTYGAGIVVFSDGNAVLNHPDLIPENAVDEEEYDRIVRVLGQAWVDDLRFVLDEVELLNDGSIPSIFTDKLDLNRVGFFGHSTGGGAVIEACYLDSRCKAGLTEDAWLVPFSREMLSTGLDQPFFFLQSEDWSGERNTVMFDTLFNNLHSPVTAKLSINGTKHYDFTDIPMLTPLAPLIGLKGPINAQRSLSIINAYTVAFFDQTLKNIPSTLLDGQSADYPETIFTLAPHIAE